MGPDAMILVFWMLSFKPTFSLSSFTSWQIYGETVSDFNLGGSKITADGDSSHEIKRRLLLCRGPASAESRDILRMDDVGKWRKIDKEIKKETRGDQASSSEAHLLYSSRGFYTLSYIYSKVKNAESTQHSISINFYQCQVPFCKGLILCTSSSVPEACWYSMTSFWYRLVSQNTRTMIFP